MTQLAEMTRWEPPVRVGLFTERLRLLTLCVAEAFHCHASDIAPGRTNHADARAAFVELAFAHIPGISARVLAKYLQLTEGAVRELRVKAGNQADAFVWSLLRRSAQSRYLERRTPGMA